MLLTFRIKLIKFKFALKQSTMKSLTVSKSRIKFYLAERLAKNIINTDEQVLAEVLRYNPIGGFEFLTDEDLFEYLNASIPELDFVELTGADDENFHLSVLKDHKDEEEAILIDVQRALQVI